MKHTFLLIVFCSFLCLAGANAQTEQLPVHKTSLPIITNLPAAIATHVPVGYEVLDTAFGNLNLDSMQDLVIVLRSPKEDTSLDSINNIRPLLVLFGNKQGGYTLAFKNNSVVDCITCGGHMGDPFEGIIVKKGYFEVVHYGGDFERWTKTVAFRFNKADKRFYLYKKTISSYYLRNPNKSVTTVKDSRNFGTVDFENYNNDEP